MFLLWNPTSAPVVSPCESRWLQQSEKCLEFANPGLWASSCLVFFLAWYLQISVCSLGWRSGVKCGWSSTMYQLVELDWTKSFKCLGYYSNHTHSLAVRNLLLSIFTPAAYAVINSKLHGNAFLCHYTCLLVYFSMIYDPGPGCVRACQCVMFDFSSVPQLLRHF